MFYEGYWISLMGITLFFDYGQSISNFPLKEEKALQF